jgi:hypothetical protein
MAVEFEIFGYSVDYHIKGKYIGDVRLDKKDREQVGYLGRKVEILKENIIFKNGKKIKSGTEIMTMMYPLCGKIKNNN